MAESNDEPKKNKGKIFGIISLALGIISIVFGTFFGCCCLCYSPIFNFIPTVIAIAGAALGVVSTVLSKKSGVKDKLGTLGLVLSIAAIALMIALFIVSIIIVIAGNAINIIFSMMYA